jgi:hypothetical protein
VNIIITETEVRNKISYVTKEDSDELSALSPSPVARVSIPSSRVNNTKIIYLIHVSL